MFSKRTPKSKRHRQLKHQLLSTVFLVASLCAIVIFCVQYAYTPSHVSSPNSRNLLSTLPFYDRDWELPYKIIGADYPLDAFTKNQLDDGAWLLHFIGLLYMFLAIAIVCDEFFVPSIEEIVDALNLAPDVAGATFMAAGGSAPELFTSFFGVFVAKSSVGFGTIVGSAVFNVLFVIGCCAIFSSGDLILTWYPFARDAIYYCTSLVILAIFFTDQLIYFYEALILFILYMGYVTLMINNARLYKWIDEKFLKTDPRKRAASQAEQLRPPQAIQTFSVSLFKMMTADADISEIAGIHMVARIKGDVKATFRQIDKDGNGFIDKDELREVLQTLRGEISEEEVDACYQELDENDDGKIDEHEFRRWYLRSETRIEADVNQLFNKFDKDGSGFIDMAELENLVMACQADGVMPNPEEVAAAAKILDANGDGKISREEFLNWYKESKFFEANKKRRDTLIEEEEKEEEEGVSLEFPENMKGRILYVISAPIMYTLYFTVPDVRKKRWKAWWPVAFLSSILWLGVYSYFMVWWATVIGRILRIPDEIMGLTLLAAGTSVPDLITSVLVAKEGHGDMAVSSSIGSNIFDVLVGLPLPWLFYTMINGKPLEVFADSIAVSIFILFAMILIVLIIIKLSKWRMTRTLGYSMFVLYFLFCLQDILRNPNLINW